MPNPVAADIQRVSRFNQRMGGYSRSAPSQPKPKSGFMGGLKNVASRFIKNFKRR